MTSAHEALNRLREGNLRFTTNVWGANDFLTPIRRFDDMQLRWPNHGWLAMPSFVAES